MVVTLCNTMGTTRLKTMGILPILIDILQRQTVLSIISFGKQEQINHNPESSKAEIINFITTQQRQKTKT